MEESKYLERVVKNGIFFGSILEHYFIENFNNLGLSKKIEEKIENAISDRKNFEIPQEEFTKILYHLDLEIDKLLKSPDFNPFKEELRRNFPEQYSDSPFVYKGKTYYLYSKTFPIDSQIISIINFKKLINFHIEKNYNLKFIYKD